MREGKVPKMCYLFVEIGDLIGKMVTLAEIVIAKYWLVVFDEQELLNETGRIHSLGTRKMELVLETEIHNQFTSQFTRVKLSREPL